MALPKSELMKQQEAEADRMIADLTPPVVDSGEPDVVDEAPADDAPTDAQNTDEGLPPVESVPSEPVDTEGELIAQLRAEIATSEQRYKTLQGMIKDRDRDISDLRLLVSTLSEARATPAAEPAPIVTDKDTETFGPELIDLISRVVKQTVSPLLHNVEGRVDSVAKVATTAVGEIFDSELESLVPDWRAVNISDEFIAWLGKWNLKALNEAYNARDLQGTAKFFNDFKASQQPAAAASAPAAPAPVVDRLERLAGPAKGKSVPVAPDANRGKIWTPAEINKLYDDLDRKRISQTEFDKLEADMFKAQRDGRIAA